MKAKIVAPPGERPTRRPLARPLALWSRRALELCVLSRAPRLASPAAVNGPLERAGGQPEPLTGWLEAVAIYR